MSELPQLHFQEGDVATYIFSGLCEAGKQLSLESFIPSMNQEGRREGEGAYLGAESLALLQSLLLQRWLEFHSPLSIIHVM